MVLIVGLGNPGKKYQNTRHNLGFRVVERLAAALEAGPWKTQGEVLVARGSIGARPFMLAKPQTYMNLSGKAVAFLLGYYKIELDDCLVVVDDLDLALGKIRQRRHGSDGGHRGLRSIIEAVGSRSFKRVRIGIGRPGGLGGAKRGSVVSFVLGQSPREAAVLTAAEEETVRVVIRFLESGEFENWSASVAETEPQG